VADRYDVVVIGGGPGGYVAAIRSSQLGLKTALVERENLGGICLNWGCIPSKALLRNAELAHILTKRAKDFGFSFDNVRLDYKVAVKRSRQVSNRLVKGVEFLMRKNKIDVYRGTGELVATDQVQVTDKEGNVQVLTASNVIVATGARPRSIPGVAFDDKHILSYRPAIVQDTLPQSVIIIGAGPIGMEFGYVWHNYGVQVTIVEMLPHLLPLEDEEVSREMEKAFQREGIRFHTHSRVESVEVVDEGVKVVVRSGEETSTLQAEQVLMAIGVRPNTENFGLERVGVQLDGRGFIAVDAGMRTNVPGIYAIGDVTGKTLLAHVASAQGIVAAETIAGVETVELNYEMMPRAVYCQPQVASFGLTEKQAKERGYDVRVGKFPFQANGKALGLGESRGFVKIVADAKYGEILGAHMVGPEVTELLPELTLAQAWELTPEEVARNVHAHPTLSEVIMEAAHAWGGHAIHI